MCSTCGVSGCSCKKRHCSAVDKVLVPGPQGIQGEQGDAGPQGDPGTPGGGGMAFEHFFTAPIDAVWGNPITVQPEFNYTVTADGEYQIHINLRVQLGGNGFRADGSLLLYINNVVVDTLQVSYPNLAIFPPGEKVEQDNVFFWRGTILNGQNVEVKHSTTGSSFIASTHGNMLINKES